jgi:hypothetical protein
MYQPIPFYPAIVSGSGAALGTSSDVQTWVNQPSRCDLTFYQGDDVTVPLTIEDPADSTPDMSTEWEWSAQIRVFHSYHTTLVNTFSVKDAYTPPVGETPGFTEVTMFLPRTENIYVGRYRWDLYSKAPFDATGFPQPPDVIAPEPWPPTDQIRTWIYGMVTILPRVTATDILNDDLPEIDDGSGSLVQMNFFVGPNGRVP